NSPQLKADLLNAKAAHKGVGIAQSGYYPSVDLDGIDSWGFPGSSGDLGIGGLMGSPYRSGTAGGVVARETLFDFGRTFSGVKTAESIEKLRNEEIAIDKYSVDLDALQTFYQCSRFRSEYETWSGLYDETELVAKEVAMFVDTGQRSIVDQYLAKSQVEEARTNRDYYTSRTKSTASRLAMLMGVSESHSVCPGLPEPEANVPLYPTDAINPYVVHSQTEVEAAKNQLFQAKTDFLPKIVGMASAGAMENVRLVDRTDYSGGLGVVIPIFDGLGTVNRVGQARAQLDAKTQELGAVQLQMDEVNAKYDDIIVASREKIERLEGEQKLAQDGFKVAKSRYFKLQGTLVDLRDALRNLSRIEIEMRDTQADLLETSGSKALLNGSASVKPAQIDEKKP